MNRVGERATVHVHSVPRPSKLVTEALTAISQDELDVLLADLNARGRWLLGAADVIPTLEAALATGTPLVIARRAALIRADRVDVPAPLRDLDGASGCGLGHVRNLGFHNNVAGGFPITNEV